MNNALYTKIKDAVELQHYKMNSSWFQDCMEYYLQEHVNPLQEEIVEFVIAQWQLSDLREICNESPCLPSNLANQKVVNLPKKYVLQVDKMYDITTSKYKQYQKLTNVSTENIDATENENSNATQANKTQSTEPKAKRMYYLDLTDGVQNIKGMEYEAIRDLTDTILPGYKILIIGPVVCRRGLLLLKENNVRKLGGEVEKLLIPNAQENVFARALNLKENPDPYKEQNNLVNQVVPVVNENEREHLNSQLNLGLQLVDSIDTAMQMKELSSKKKNAGPATNQLKKTIADCRTQIANMRNSVIDFNDEDDDMFFNIEDDLYGTMDHQIPVKATEKNQNLNKNRVVSATPPIIASYDLTADSPVKQKETDKIKKNSASTSNSHANSVSAIENLLSKQPSPLQPMYKYPVSNTNNLNCIPDDDLFDELDFNDIDTITKMQITKVNEKDKEFEKNLNEIEKSLSILSDKSKSNRESNCSTTNNLSDSGKKRVANVISPARDVPSKLRCLEKSSKMDNSRKITDFMTKSSTSTKDNTENATKTNQCNSEVFDLLHNVLKKPLKYQNKTLTVRGKILTLDSLKMVKPDGVPRFQLSATITDDTDKLRVEFSSQVIEKLVGYNVEQFNQLKKKGKTDEKTKEKLRNDLIKVQEYLQIMDAYMEIIFKSKDDVVVVSAREMKDEEKTILKKQIESYNLK